MSDLISREDVLEGLKHSTAYLHDDIYIIVNRIPSAEATGALDEAIAKYVADGLMELPSADAVSQSEQYKKGFEDAKRAFLIEYARESENMRKRNAELEVMLNIQKALLAERNWIPCSESLPQCGIGMHYLVTLKYGHCFKDDVYEAFFDKNGWHMGYNELADDEVIAWMPLPTPYKESEVEE